MIFICYIIQNGDIEQVLINAEIVLIYADTLEEAFGKILVVRNYSNIVIIDLKENRLLAKVEIMNDTNPMRYILIGEPNDIFVRFSKI